LGVFEGKLLARDISVVCEKPDERLNVLVKEVDQKMVQQDEWEI
jgi:hypothetical protein